MLNIGFIGTGRMGLAQGRAFAQLRNVRIAAAANRGEANREAFGENHPSATLYADYHDLLADPAIDAVVISTPTLDHRRHTIDALAAGKHVLVEKPMARTVADCRAMVAAARKHRRLLMVAHVRRFDPDWALFKKLVDNGTLGRPVLWRQVTSNFPPKQKWILDDRQGGGTMLDGAVHNIDFANLVFGRAKDVIASEIRLGPDTAVDTANAVVRYAGGDQAMFSRSWGPAATGTYVIDALGPKASLLFGGGTLNAADPAADKFGYYQLTSAATGKTKQIRYRKRDIYADQARHFVDCVLGKAKCRSTGEDAMQAIAVIEAIFAAAKRGGVKKVPR